MKHLTRQRLHLYAAIALSVLVLIVLLQNMEPVETQLLTFAFTLPLALLLAATVLVGLAIGLLLSWWRFR